MLAVDATKDMAAKWTTHKLIFSFSAKMKGKWQGSAGFLAGQDLNGPPDIVRVPSKACHIQLENMLSRNSE